MLQLRVFLVQRGSRLGRCSWNEAFDDCSKRELLSVCRQVLLLEEMLTRPKVWCFLVFFFVGVLLTLRLAGGVRQGMSLVEFFLCWLTNLLLMLRRHHQSHGRFFFADFMAQVGLFLTI